MVAGRRLWALAAMPLAVVSASRVDARQYGGALTSTVFETTYITITSCSDYVTSCPARSTVVSTIVTSSVITTSSPTSTLVSTSPTTTSKAPSSSPTTPISSSKASSIPITSPTSTRKASSTSTAASSNGDCYPAGDSTVTEISTVTVTSVSTSTTETDTVTATASASLITIIKVIPTTITTTTTRSYPYYITVCAGSPTPVPSDSPTDDYPTDYGITAACTKGCHDHDTPVTCVVSTKWSTVTETVTTTTSATVTKTEFSVSVSGTTATEKITDTATVTRSLTDTTTATRNITDTTTATVVTTYTTTGHRRYHYSTRSYNRVNAPWRSHDSCFGVGIDTPWICYNSAAEHSRNTADYSYRTADHCYSATDYNYSFGFCNNSSWLGNDASWVGDHVAWLSDNTARLSDHVARICNDTARVGDNASWIDCYIAFVPPVTVTAYATATATNTICAAPTNGPGTFPQFYDAKSDLTWGCSPGKICSPPKPDGCLIWAEPPAKEYVCPSQSYCVDAPVYKNATWEPEETGYFPPNDIYYNLPPTAFGLTYDIFKEDFVPEICIDSAGEKYTTTRATGNWESQTSITRYTATVNSLPAVTTYAKRSPGLRSRALAEDPTIPSMCYDDCNDALLEGQRLGKTSALCQDDSVFNENVKTCDLCMSNHKSCGIIWLSPRRCYILGESIQSCPESNQYRYEYCSAKHQYQYQPDQHPISNLHVAYFFAYFFPYPFPFLYAIIFDADHDYRSQFYSGLHPNEQLDSYLTNNQCRYNH
ncbi:hypothetical protein PG985_005207 [Apiospora marii]|uniref:Apple domain-containing protein n=1 Tax=Apiospora marii TaxID=335849 RepID=A0ABR1SD45_9PEZI